MSSSELSSDFRNSNVQREESLKDSIEVSVVIPAKNEEETIGICISKVKEVFERERITGEIIVSDSSEDRTPVIAERLGARVVKPDRNGYGYAYRYAFQYVRGRYVVIGDADDTYDFAEMPKLLEPLRRGEADLVIGSRLKGKIEKGAMPWHHRWIGNPILTWFLNLFFKAGISDAHSGFRAIRRDALEKLDLTADGMEFASEMIIEAVRKGLRIKEVPISYYKRKGSCSKLSSFSDGWRHLKFMLINAPDYLFVYPGAVLLALGLFLMLSVLLKVYIGYFPGVHSMIAGSLLVIVGYQVVFFGLFAKIYQRRGNNTSPLTPEKGITVGILMLIFGIVWVSFLLFKWRITQTLPPIELDIVGLVLIVLGIQTFFSSFMLSVISAHTSVIRD